MLARIVGALSKVMGIAAAAATALLGITVLADVIGRNVFNAPIAGALEVVQYWWMVALVWLGIGFAQHVDEHLRVTLLPGGLGERGAAVLTGLTNLLGVVCGVLLIGPSWQAALDSAAMGESVVGSVAVPIWPLTFLVPLGFIVFIAVCLVQAVACSQTALSKVETHVE